MASTYLSRSESSAGSSTKATLSAWVKRSKITSDYPRIFSSYIDNSNHWKVYFDNTDRLNVYGEAGGSLTCQVITSRKFRDTNAFYNLIVAVDSTQGSSSDRIKVYVNGVQETAFDTATYPSSSANMKFNGGSGNTDVIGKKEGASSDYFDGILSHVHFIDGTQYAASDFGETDSTTGEWKIKTSPSVTYGTNGFFILKDGNSVTDSSTNSNNFTVGGGTLTKTEDNPSNVYTVWNANSTVSYKQSGNPIVFSNGATSLLENGGEYKNAISTLGAFTGKYYFETKMISPNNSLAESTYVGVVTATAQANVGDNYNHVGYTANSVGYNSYAGQVFTSDSGSNYGASLANGDILGVALDITNLKVYLATQFFFEASSFLSNIETIILMRGFFLKNSLLRSTNPQ